MTTTTTRCDGSGQRGHRTICPHTHAFCATCGRIMSCPDPGDLMPEHDRQRLDRRSMDQLGLPRPTPDELTALGAALDAAAIEAKAARDHRRATTEATDAG